MFSINTCFVIYYQSVSPKDERIVSANPSLDAASIGLSRDVIDQPEFSDVGGDLGTTYSHNAYASHEQTMYYGGQFLTSLLLLWILV